MVRVYNKLGLDPFLLDKSVLWNIIWLFIYRKRLNAIIIMGVVEVVEKYKCVGVQQDNILYWSASVKLSTRNGPE